MGTKLRCFFLLCTISTIACTPVTVDKIKENRKSKQFYYAYNPRPFGYVARPAFIQPAPVAPFAPVRQAPAIIPLRYYAPSLGGAGYGYTGGIYPAAIRNQDVPIAPAFGYQPSPFVGKLPAQREKVVLAATPVTSTAEDEDGIQQVIVKKPIQKTVEEKVEPLTVNEVFDIFKQKYAQQSQNSFTKDDTVEKEDEDGISVSPPRDEDSEGAFGPSAAFLSQLEAIANGADSEIVESNEKVQDYTKVNSVFADEGKPDIESIQLVTKPPQATFDDQLVTKPPQATFDEQEKHVEEIEMVSDLPAEASDEAMKDEEKVEAEAALHNTAQYPLGQAVASDEPKAEQNSEIQKDSSVQEQKVEAEEKVKEKLVHDEEVNAHKEPLVSEKTEVQMDESPVVSDNTFSAVKEAIHDHHEKDFPVVYHGAEIPTSGSNEPHHQADDSSKDLEDQVGVHELSVDGTKADDSSKDVEDKVVVHEPSVSEQEQVTKLVALEDESPKVSEPAKLEEESGVEVVKEMAVSDENQQEQKAKDQEEVHHDAFAQKKEEVDYDAPEPEKESSKTEMVHDEEKKDKKDDIAEDMSADEPTKNENEKEVVEVADDKSALDEEKVKDQIHENVAPVDQQSADSHDNVEPEEISEEIVKTVASHDSAQNHPSKLSAHVNPEVPEANADDSISEEVKEDVIKVSLGDVSSSPAVKERSDEVDSEEEKIDDTFGPLLDPGSLVPENDGDEEDWSAFHALPKVQGLKVIPVAADDPVADLSDEHSVEKVEAAEVVAAEDSATEVTNEEVTTDESIVESSADSSLDEGPQDALSENANPFPEFILEKLKAIQSLQTENLAGDYLTLDGVNSMINKVKAERTSLEDLYSLLVKIQVSDEVALSRMGELGEGHEDNLFPEVSLLLRSHAGFLHKVDTTEHKQLVVKMLKYDGDALKFLGRMKSRLSDEVPEKENSNGASVQSYEDGAEKELESPVGNPLPKLLLDELKAAKENQIHLLGGDYLTYDGLEGMSDSVGKNKIQLEELYTLVAKIEITEDELALAQLGRTEGEMNENLDQISKVENLFRKYAHLLRGISLKEHKGLILSMITSDDSSLDFLERLKSKMKEQLKKSEEVKSVEVPVSVVDTVSDEVISLPLNVKVEVPLLDAEVAPIKTEADQYVTKNKESASADNGEKEFGVEAIVDLEVPENSDSINLASPVEVSDAEIQEVAVKVFNTPEESENIKEVNNLVGDSHDKVQFETIQQDPVPSPIAEDLMKPEGGLEHQDDAPIEVKVDQYPTKNEESASADNGKEKFEVEAIVDLEVPENSNTINFDTPVEVSDAEIQEVAVKVFNIPEGSENIKEVNDPVTDSQVQFEAVQQDPAPSPVAEDFANPEQPDAPIETEAEQYPTKSEESASADNGEKEIEVEAIVDLEVPENSDPLALGTPVEVSDAKIQEVAAKVFNTPEGSENIQEVNNPMADSQDKVQFEAVQQDPVSSPVAEDLPNPDQTDAQIETEASQYPTKSEEFASADNGEKEIEVEAIVDLEVPENSDALALGTPVEVSDAEIQEVAIKVFNTPEGSENIQEVNNPVADSQVQFEAAQQDPAPSPVAEDLVKPEHQAGFSNDEEASLPENEPTLMVEPAGIVKEVQGANQDGLSQSFQEEASSEIKPESDDESSLVTEEKEVVVAVESIPAADQVPSQEVEEKPLEDGVPVKPVEASVIAKDEEEEVKVIPVKDDSEVVEDVGISADDVAVEVDQPAVKVEGAPVYLDEQIRVVFQTPLADSELSDLSKTDENEAVRTKYVGGEPLEPVISVRADDQEEIQSHQPVGESGAVDGVSNQALDATLSADAQAESQNGQPEPVFAVVSVYSDGSDDVQKLTEEGEIQEFVVPAEDQNTDNLKTADEAPLFEEQPVVQTHNEVEAVQEEKLADIDEDSNKVEPQREWTVKVHPTNDGNLQVKVIGFTADDHPEVYSSPGQESVHGSRPNNKVLLDGDENFVVIKDKVVQHAQPQIPENAQPQYLYDAPPIPVDLVSPNADISKQAEIVLDDGTVVQPAEKEDLPAKLPTTDPLKYRKVTRLVYVPNVKYTPVG